MEQQFRHFDDLESETLVRGRFHRGLFYFDLLAYDKGWRKDYPLFRSVLRRVPASRQETVRPRVEVFIRKQAQANYFFAK